MASSTAATVAAAAAEAPPPPSDGPVLSLMNKRLRALRKKHNRILQTEESQAKGRPLNAEQEEVLRSKPAVLALIDEYEKLRQPLASALQDELARYASPPPPPPPPPSAPDNDAAAVEDLIGLLYFGALFDVKPQSEFTATMLTRAHERGCCLTYDYVTDESTELLAEEDLDAVSALGALVTSRPASVGVSHREALRGCVQRAMLWLDRSDQPIHPGAAITYAGLREKLNKIMASDYVTITPEIKPTVDVAAAVGQFNTASQVQVLEPVTAPEPAPNVQIKDVPNYYHDKQEDVEEEFQETDGGTNQSSPTEEFPNGEVDVPNPSEDTISAQQELQKAEPDVEEQNQRDTDQREQQGFPRRAFQNQRGGRSRGGGGTGGRRGGYANGRGGRGGGRSGGFQNGQSQYYDPGYYPRNYYNPRGRGGRSGGSATPNNHASAAAQGGYPPANGQ